ncbi:unnamed protein product [Lupinus luteus]|uniref:EDS1 EP domain-containing protein n=1 Tax=Lupinus luteus TaxID=3873 RepID=A0AAV1XEP6_LUPLU
MEVMASRPHYHTLTVNHAWSQSPSSSQATVNHRRSPRFITNKKNAFKKHKRKTKPSGSSTDPDEDFQANVKRLELAAIWDEIIELLRKYNLPDFLEGDEEWINIGTRFRRLVEPLDISNYYRHLRHLEVGPYMGKGRPGRYRYTQRWFEHYKRNPEEQISESCFWATVEDLWYETSNKMKSFEDVKKDVEKIEGQIKKWVDDKELDKGIFVEGSTLVKWWNSLPQQHRQGSCIRSFIETSVL